MNAYQNAVRKNCEDRNGGKFPQLRHFT